MKNLSKEKTQFGIVHKDIFSDDRLDKKTKLVYTALCTYANAQGECWPSHETIMKDCSIKKKQTLIDALNSLEKNGYIKRFVNRKERKPTVYTLTLFITKPIQKQKDKQVHSTSASGEYFSYSTGIIKANFNPAIHDLGKSRDRAIEARQREVDERTSKAN